MALIETNISTGSDAFRANRDGMLTLLARVRELEERTRRASAASKERFAKRSQLLPRERLSLLLDHGTPFLELSTLCGYQLDNPDPEKSIPGGGVVAGIGYVSGVRCMISASDSGIDAGALQPRGIDKQLRVQELALENKLPYIQLVESAGANLMTYRVEEFVRGGSLFRNLARISAAGLPVITVTHGSSTAGGAYQTGLSDYIIMVRGRSRAFLAGPPLLMAATGEIATEEELGGAEMHTAISGLGDYLAEDDRDALRIVRDLLGKLDWNHGAAAEKKRPARPPRYDAEELLGIMPMDHKRPVDMKEVIARIVDDSDFVEFGCALWFGDRLRTRADRWLRDRHHHQQRPDRPGRRRQGHPFHPGLLSGAGAAALPQQHDRLHGRARLRRGRQHQARFEDDPGRDERHRAADHDLLRRFVRRRQLRHVRPRLPSALLLLLAERQDRGDGRRTGRPHHGRSSPRRR